MDVRIETEFENGDIQRDDRGRLLRLTYGEGQPLEGARQS
ncbi:hypothetical protein GGE12_005463 [Rhizobium mongolense]|uniref:Uncharacterized protein n=1 Tax=Rhizobium mongolense TaxID=57676 RepID=A0A7W6WHC0_9HYPH|nr:hypothetical protein [Rhizobium mongolense]